MGQGPHTPIFQAYRKDKRRHVYYVVPAAPDLEPIDVTGLMPAVAGWHIARAIAEHFDLEPNTFGLEFH